MSPWAQAPSTVRPWLAGVSAPGRVNGTAAVLRAGRVRSKMSLAAGMSPALGGRGQGLQDGRHLLEQAVAEIGAPVARALGTPLGVAALSWLPGSHRARHAVFTLF